MRSLERMLFTATIFPEFIIGVGTQLTLCSDHFSWDDSVRFYQLALQVAKEEGFEGRVCHETHRNRSMFNPYAADYILQRVPEYVLYFTRCLHKGRKIC
jgi:hypothetical protein